MKNFLKTLKVFPGPRVMYVITGYSKLHGEGGVVLNRFTAVGMEKAQDTLSERGFSPVKVETKFWPRHRVNYTRWREVLRRIERERA